MIPSGFPLYPRSDSRLYNVSLSLPGPMLYDTPIGSFAEKSKYPNEKSSILFPNTDFISKFASYNIGISDFMTKSSLDFNMSRLPEDNLDVKNQFENTFNYSNQDGMGLRSIEKSLLSSMFESQKPFFEITRITSSISMTIEDILARISPIFGAAIVGPDSALSVRSRKPVGNGPKNQSDPNGMGVYGTPPAIGYSGGSDIKSKISKFKSISNKDSDISITTDGIATITRKPIKISEGSDGYEFIYATISTIYSTGEFDPTIQYAYKYIDIDADNIPIEDPEIEDLIPEDTRPERIIIGIFDSDGTAINPRDKIRYWDVDQNGELFKAESIFEKASWIYQTDKWILDRSIFPSSIVWSTVNPDLYHWIKFGQIVIQSNSPGDGWEKMKYKDVMDFESEENKIYKFKENDPIVSFTDSSINHYIKYYDEISEDEISKADLDPEDKEEMRSHLKSIYPPSVIIDHLQSLISMGKLKISYYLGTEVNDWNKYQSSSAPTGTYSEFNSNLRKSFNPMKFNIGGKDVWIDPETDYDYKIIRVDSTSRIDYKKTSGITPDVVKDIDIDEFIKNRFSIKVSDISGQNQILERSFSIDVYKNGSLFENFQDISDYSLINWNVEFDNSTFTKKDDNFYRFVVYLPGNEPPQSLLNIQPTIRQMLNPGKFTAPREGYEDTLGSIMENWEIVSSVSEGVEIIANKIIKSGENYYYGESEYEYFTDIRNDPTLISQADEALSSGNIQLSNQLRIQARTTFLRYVIENQNNTGEYTLPIYGYRDMKIQVENNKIIRWIIYDKVVVNSIYNLPGMVTFGGVDILPKFFKKNEITFNLTSTSTDSTDGSGNVDTLLITDIPKFQARLSDGVATVIDSTNILNDDLITNDLYSSGIYGVGYRGDQSEPDKPISIGYLRRNQLTELDVETYYIIEAVKENSNSTNPDNTSSSSSSGGGGFYRLPHALGIVPATLKMNTSIFTKLIPTIKKTIKLIKNPSGFVTEIVKSKVEDHYSIFSPISMSLLVTLPQMSQKVKSSASDFEKRRNLNSMRDEVRKSSLGNYIYVDDDGNHKFLLDGSALINLFGFNFGIKLDLTKDEVPIKPIFSGKSNVDDLINKFNIQKNDYELINGVFSSKENIENYTFNYKEDNIDTIKSTSGDDIRYEEISVKYSTGKYIEGIDYKYIYINQEVSKILSDGDTLASDTSNIDDIEKAILKYEEAYEIIEKGDPDNLSLKKEILERIDGLKQKINIISQPIFKFLLGLTTLPLKIIFEIINWMLDFFKKMTNPTKIPGLMIEFLSFDWIMKFFTPKGIFEMAGIKFNPQKVAMWCVLANKKKSNGEYFLDDDFPLADLNQFLSIAFESTLPIYTAKQYRDMCLKPFRQFSPLLCLFERIINGFIMLIWSILGITAIIPPPLIKICSRINENIDINSFNEILNDLFSGISSGGNSESSNSYSFIYEVNLSNGDSRENLDKESLQKFINDNKSVNFEFINFETIE